MQLPNFKWIGSKVIVEMQDEILFDKPQVNKLGFFVITTWAELLESSYGSNFWASRIHL